MPDPCLLSPTKGALELHIKRANYQVFICKKAAEREPDIPSPVGHGQDVKDGYIEVMWMTEKPALESVLELIGCSCKRKCGSDCQCLKHGLNCTDVCPCSDTCKNLLADCWNDDDDNDSSDESDCGDETDNKSNFEDNLEDEKSNNDE